MSDWNWTMRSIRFMASGASIRALERASRVGRRGVVGGYHGPPPDRPDARLPDPPLAAEPRRAVRDVADRLRGRLRDRRSGADHDQPRGDAGRCRRSTRGARPRPAADHAVPALRHIGAARRLRSLVRVQRVGDRPRARTAAGDARAGNDGAGDRGRARHPARAVGGRGTRIDRRQGDPRRLDDRLFAADLLGRRADDPAVLGHARLAAGVGSRRDGPRVRRVVVLPHARRLEAPAAAGREPRALQARAGDPARARAGRARRSSPTTCGMRGPRACRKRGSSAYMY